jgi:hypothetical protein
LSNAPPGRTGGGGASRARASATDSLARGVFALLVLACLVAFFLTQRLKHTPTPVQKFKRTPRFSPYPSGHEREEQISFKLAHADAVTVTVINTKGDTVATLISDRAVPRYKQFSLRWNGRRGSPAGYRAITSPGGRAILVPRNHGAIAPAGEYRVRVFLHRQDKTVLSPWSFTLVAP